LSAARRLWAITTAAVEATFGSRSSRYGRASSVSSARPSRASATIAAARTSGDSSERCLRMFGRQRSAVAGGISASVFSTRTRTFGDS
jgi:hypothetical protein